MKKLYSTILVLAFGLISAQGTESFDKSPFAVTPIGDGTTSYVGDTAGVIIKYTKISAHDNYQITGKGAILHYANDNTEPKDSSLEFVIPNGVGEFKFQYRTAYTTRGERKLSVYVNDKLEGTTEVFDREAQGAASVTYDFSVKPNINGEVRIKIMHSDDTTGRTKQVNIDNVSWTAYDPTLSTENIVKNDVNLVKNTLVSNEILFGAKADIKIFNINGQVVKSASVNENTRLDVSSFANGIYIITGVVNGKTISQKIIKK